MKNKCPRVSDFVFICTYYIKVKSKMIALAVSIILFFLEKTNVNSIISVINF